MSNKDPTTKFSGKISTEFTAPSGGVFHYSGRLTGLDGKPVEFSFQAEADFDDPWKPLRERGVLRS